MYFSYREIKSECSAGNVTETEDMSCGNVTPPLIRRFDDRIIRNGSINNYTSYIKKREKDAVNSASSLPQSKVRGQLGTERFIATEIGKVL